MSADLPLTPEQLGHLFLTKRAEQRAAGTEEEREILGEVIDGIREELTQVATPAELEAILLRVRDAERAAG